MQLRMHLISLVDKVPGSASTNTVCYLGSCLKEVSTFQLEVSASKDRNIYPFKFRDTVLSIGLSLRSSGLRCLLLLFDCI